MNAFTVIACNPSNEGKTFVWKLAIESKAVVFGITKIVKRTYYIGGMPSAAAVGAVLQEDLSKFNIVERDFTPDEEGAETIKLKWLHVKVA